MLAEYVIDSRDMTTVIPNNKNTPDGPIDQRTWWVGVEGGILRWDFDPVGEKSYNDGAFKWQVSSRDLLITVSMVSTMIELDASRTRPATEDPMTPATARKESPIPLQVRNKKGLSCSRV